ncbi:MAG: carbohydrate porin [Deltaproteobacteria bacterium]|jgi:maltoporin|nr:carbohydrate porin [Deltaproteobacteria bacterium]
MNTFFTVFSLLFLLQNTDIDSSGNPQDTVNNNIPANQPGKTSGTTDATSTTLEYKRVSSPVSPAVKTKQPVSTSTDDTSSEQNKSTVETAADPSPEQNKTTEKQTEKSDKEDKSIFSNFGFGSYGRVNFGSNFDGEPIYPVNITTHGPRLEESTYLELDLYYLYNPVKSIKTKTVTTLALKNSLFHYNAQWDASIAVRNLYLQVQQENFPHLYLWAGSRMYRGDDIYLLDYWPLDNLNTLGAGIWYDKKPLRGGLHIGTNRVLGQYQYQEMQVSDPFIGARTITTMNRQRTIASFKLEYWKKLKNSIGFKVKGYTEFHLLPSGTYNALESQEEQIDFPNEQGYVAGAQIGIWDFHPHSFLNIFARYGKGLGAYGEFSQPLGLGWSQDYDTNYSVEGAQDLVLAFSANFVVPKRFGLMAGGYYRYFKDADNSNYDWDDGTEMVFSVRPHLWIPELTGNNFALAGEISWQHSSRNGLYPDTQTSLSPSVWKFSLIPTWISGFNTYSRPAIRLVYTMAMLNEDARKLYHENDWRVSRKVEHFIGIQAEWWFNSSTYQ